MRLSGTSLERLIYLFLPISLIVGIVLIFYVNITMAIKMLGIGMLSLWALDSLFMLIWFHPKKLVTENGGIRYGDNHVAFNQVESIEIVSGSYLPIFRLDYTMTKIKLVTSEVIYAIPKPTSIRDLINSNFAPTAAVIWSIPQLRNKLIIPDRLKKKLKKKYSSEEIDA